MVKRLPMATRSLIVLPLAALLLSACGGWIGSVDPSTAPVSDVAIAPPSSQPEPAPPPVETVTAVTPELPTVIRDPALERQVASLELKLLEREAQVEELEVRLDGARRDVVRAMSRMRSLATQAEATAAIAEAESALQALSAIAAGRAADESSELLEVARAELEKGNYGGALYLANEAKSTAAAARGQFAGAGEETPHELEQPFTLPLHLQTTGRANVRQGPGTAFDVLFTLPTGAPLVAYSSAEEWLRVADDSGRRGWISQTLIRPRL